MVNKIIASIWRLPFHFKDYFFKLVVIPNSIIKYYEEDIYNRYGFDSYKHYHFLQ